MKTGIPAAAHEHRMEAKKRRASLKQKRSKKDWQ
jgi:hypothetical protein